MSRTAGPPAYPVTVNDAAQARSAVTIASEAKVPVALWSPPAAAAWMGAAYFRALVAAAREACPDALVTGVLDCGTMAGHVLAALREGVDGVCFTGDAAVADRLDDIARRYGRVLYRRRPDMPDLDGVTDPLAVCRKWMLQQGG